MAVDPPFDGSRAAQRGSGRRPYRREAALRATIAAMRNAQASAAARRWRSYAANAPRERPVRAAGARRLRGARLARPATASPGTTTKSRRSRPLEALVHGHLAALPAPRARLRRLARRARAVRAAARALGRRALAVYRARRRCPACWPLRVLGVWLVARMRRGRRSRARAARSRSACAWPTRSRCARWKSATPRSCSARACASAPCCSPATGARRCARRASLLGLAIANKQWALLAAGPVLLRPAAPRAGLRCLAAAAAVAGAILAPLLLVGSGGFVTARARERQPPASTIFQPWQVWWFLGHHGALVHGAVRRRQARLPGRAGLDGTRQPPARRRSPGSRSRRAVAARAGRRARRRAPGAARARAGDARCAACSTRGTPSYYLLPFVLALLAWEVAARRRCARPCSP